LVDPFFIDVTIIDNGRPSSAAVAICQLFLVRRPKSGHKKRTKFSKGGGAAAQSRTHNARMKTQALLGRGSSTAIDLKRILVPVDFSPLSRKAIHYATRLAQQFGAKLNLFHVVEPEVPPAFDGYMIAPPVISHCASNGYANRLDRLANSVRTAGVNHVQSTVRMGLAAFEIVEAAKELDVDLIVIATHGYTGWKHFAIGSTAERVVRAAPCPVLVVREKEHEFV
jgi:universal stress protein A